MNDIRSKASPLTPDDLHRYSRHILLPQVGTKGQEKLKAARVLIIGAGGLGSPTSLYLAAAGIGTIGLVEFDTVDRTNLQRQILYADADVGRPKAEAAKDRLQALSPHLKVEIHPEALGPENAARILSGYDVVIDGTDNFSTRYLVNDACVLLDKPNVYGTIFRFDGQASVFDARTGPCYRCLFPAPPPADQVPNCAEGGVLGVLPGLIGMIQATETLKLILGIGSTLAGRLLTIDAMTMRFHEFKLAKDPRCEVCGEKATLRTPDDLVRMHAKTPAPSCEVGGTTLENENLSVTELHSWRESRKPHVLIDVRTQGELEVCRIDGSLHIPLGEIENRTAEIDQTLPVVLHCKSGARSRQALDKLKAKGFTQLYNLQGGILAWIDQIDQNLPRY